MDLSRLCFHATLAVLLQSEVSQISISLARLHVHDARVWNALLPALLQHSNLKQEPVGQS